MEFKRIPESNMTKLEEGFAKLAKRAAKLGMVAPKLVVGETVDVEFARHFDGSDMEHVRQVTEDYPTQSHEESFFRRFIMCACDGIAPVADGWELISVIDHTTDSDIGNLIKNVPGKETPIEFRTAQPICHHCNTLRRRNSTYLLLKDGAYKQVGRNCLADFCRSPEMAESLVAGAEYLFNGEDLLSEAESDGFFDGMGGGQLYYNIESFLSMTRCIIRNFGWMSRKTVEENGFGCATASFVSSIITNYANWMKHAGATERVAVEGLNDEDKSYATLALEWIRAKKADKDSLNDYIYNQLVCCNRERITYKHFGLVASLIPAYMRDQEIEVERKLRESRPPSQHFGTIKKRETFILTVVGVNYWEGDYGVTSFCRLVDANGNIAVWKASGSIEDLKTGETYEVKGTVKSHDLWKDQRQTVLSRCKYERVSPLSEEELEEQRLAAETEKVREAYYAEANAKHEADRLENEAWIASLPKNDPSVAF